VCQIFFFLLCGIISEFETFIVVHIPENPFHLLVTHLFIYYSYANLCLLSPENLLDDVEKKGSGNQSTMASHLNDSQV
jgi:cellulose synthase A